MENQDSGPPRSGKAINFCLQCRQFFYEKKIIFCFKNAIYRNIQTFLITFCKCMCIEKAFKLFRENSESPKVF